MDNKLRQILGDVMRKYAIEARIKEIEIEGPYLIALLSTGIKITVSMDAVQITPDYMDGNIAPPKQLPKHEHS